MRWWEVAMEQRFDRSEEDLGNIVGLEHVNIMIPDQVMATLFYVTGLGLTRDPYLVTGITNMWINIGRSQFHLPTGKPQVLRGHVGLVLPDREALLRRLQIVRKGLEGSAFAIAEHDDYVAVTSPWGNRIRCHAPDPRFGRITLGMPYVQFDVPPGSLDGIVKFYRRMLGAPARIAMAALMSVPPRLSSSARATASCPPMTAITCRSISLISRVRIAASPRRG